jgi:hypothetical protein
MCFHIVPNTASRQHGSDPGSDDTPLHPLLSGRRVVEGHKRSNAEDGSSKLLKRQWVDRSSRECIDGKPSGELHRKTPQSVGAKCACAMERSVEARKFHAVDLVHHVMVEELARFEPFGLRIFGLQLIWHVRCASRF